jgi:hypothetical protein
MTQIALQRIAPLQDFDRLLTRARGIHLALDEGAIVGAGQIVLKDVQPGTIVVGNPACESKRREITQ